MKLQNSQTIYCKDRRTVSEKGQPIYSHAVLTRRQPVCAAELVKQIEEAIFHECASLFFEGTCSLVKQWETALKVDEWKEGIRHLDFTSKGRLYFFLSS